jgi:nucleoside-diphosphate-sugar epimerase
MSDRRLLVTGAGGFIGKRLIAYLRSAGFSVEGMSRTISNRAALLYPRDGQFNPRIFEGIDVVCHAAASKNIEATDECYRVNAVETSSLVAAAVAAGVRQIVYLSAANAYSAGDTPRREIDPLYPDARATAYLMSKVAGEVHVSATARAGRIAATILRPSAVYGSGMPRGMLSEFIEAARTGAKLQVYGGGTYSVDLVHVDDVIATVASVIEREMSGVFNVASGRRYTTLETAHIIASRFELPASRVELVPAANPEGIGFPAVDISRLRNELGIEPRTLEEGIRQWVEEER